MDKSIDLQVVITAEDEASAKLDGIVKKAQSLGKGMTVVGGIMATALGFAVKAASDAQVKIAKMDATLATMGKTGMNARDAIMKTSQATIKLGFDNEEAAVSIANLLQRTGDLDQATRLNTIAMDLARAKNIDLATASNMVGMVLSGNSKVLKQFGIDINETATPLEALGLLQEKVAGQSEAFSKTFAGASEVLKQQVGELGEKVGAQLLPVLSQVIAKVVPIIENILAWTEAHPQLTQNIVMAVAALTGLLVVLGPLLIMLPGIISFFGLLSPPVLIVIGIIGGLALSIYNLINIFKLLQEDGATIWLGIKTTIQESINSIIGFFQPLFDVIERVKSALSSMASSVSGAIKSAVSTVSSKISGKKAGGGNVSSGSSYLVGERGAEIFTPNSSGFITPNSALGGMSVVVNINGGTYLSESVAEDIGDMIIQRFKKVTKLSY